jgi:hypothetical protein
MKTQFRYYRQQSGIFYVTIEPPKAVDALSQTLFCGTAEALPGIADANQLPAMLSAKDASEFTLQFTPAANR